MTKRILFYLLILIFSPMLFGIFLYSPQAIYGFLGGLVNTTIRMMKKDGPGAIVPNSAINIAYGVSAAAEVVGADNLAREAINVAWYVAETSDAKFGTNFIFEETTTIRQTPTYETKRITKKLQAYFFETSRFLRMEFPIGGIPRPPDEPPFLRGLVDVRTDVVTVPIPPLPNESTMPETYNPGNRKSVN